MAQYDTAEYWAEKYDDAYIKYQDAVDRITELEAERDAIRNATLEEVAQVIDKEVGSDTLDVLAFAFKVASIVRQMKEVQGDKG